MAHNPNLIVHNPNFEVLWLDFLGHFYPISLLFVRGVPSWPHQDTTHTTSFFLVCPTIWDLLVTFYQFQMLLVAFKKAFGEHN